MSPKMRIVHAANYHFKRDGDAFFNPDLKMHHGLIQSGHFVYPFSLNDRARMLSLTGSKTFGKKQANKALIKTCINVHPDVLVLGQAVWVTPATLEAIRKELPDIKMALWYVDPIWEGAKTDHLREKLDLLDGLFITTGGELLQEYSRSNCPAAFIPNPVEASIERYQAFAEPNPKYDLTFFGVDKHAPERRVFLKKLTKSLPDIDYGIFGSLGTPVVYGFEKEQILLKSRMGLNLSRRDDVELYSSDRIGQLMGNGLLTFTPSGGGIEKLFSDEEIVFYENIEDLISKIKYFKENNSERRRIAENGWRKSHEQFSARDVAQFMVRVSTRDDAYKEACWSEHVFWA